MNNSNTIETYFQQIKKKDDAIFKAKENKNSLIKEFLSTIYQNVNILNNLWNEEEKNTINKINQLAISLNFKLEKNYKDELNRERIIESIIDKLSIENYNGGIIGEDLPSENDEWIFTYSLDDGIINLEVIPTDLDSRYPTDPENNPYQFNYHLPLEVHEKSLGENKKQVLADYLNEVITNRLILLEQQIKKEIEINEKIKSIDFSNADLVNALKKKLF